jgi:hypothetical protein
MLLWLMASPSFLQMLEDNLKPVIKKKAQGTFLFFLLLFEIEGAAAT